MRRAGPGPEARGARVMVGLSPTPPLLPPPWAASPEGKPAEPPASLRNYTAKWRLWGRAAPAPPPAPSPPRPGPRAPLPAGRGDAGECRQGRGGPATAAGGDRPAEPGPLSCLCRFAPPC